MEKCTFVVDQVLNNDTTAFLFALISGAAIFLVFCFAADRYKGDKFKIILVTTVFGMLFAMFLNYITYMLLLEFTSKL